MVKRNERPVTDFFYDKTFHPVEGQVGTDPWKSVASLGASAVELLSALIDPGVEVRPDELEFVLNYRFSTITSNTGSLDYNWKIRSEDYIGYASGGVPTLKVDSYVALSPSYSHSIAGSTHSAGSLTGYFSVASLPHGAPFRVVLTAKAQAADKLVGQVHNSSYVRLIGRVVPGT